MKRRMDILPPLGGLSESTERDAQSPGTSADVLNVRGLDPRTGRVRLSQRAGTREFRQEPLCAPQLGRNVAVRYVGQVGYYQPTDDFAYAAPADWETTATVRLPGEALAATYGPSGDLYVLDTSGRVLIRGEAGETKETIPSLAASGFSPVARIQVDEAGGVYVGFAGPVVVDGRASELIRLVPSIQEGGRHQVAWKHPVGGTLQDFDYRSGTVALTYSVIGASPAESRLQYLQAVTSGLPVASVDVKAAAGSTCVRLDRFGEGVVVAPRDATRGDAVYGSPRVSWTPREFADWKTTIHAWIDAARTPISGVRYIDGQDIGAVEDARLSPSDFGVTSDSVERGLVPSSQRFATYNNGEATVQDDLRVRWEANGMGQVPAFRIPELGGLISGYATGASRNVQATHIPGYNPGSWVYALTFDSFGDGGGARTLLAQEGPAAQILYRVEVGLGSMTVESDVGGGSTVFSAINIIGPNLLVLHFDGAGNLNVRVNGALAGTIAGIPGTLQFGAYTVPTSNSAHVGPQTALGTATVQSTTDLARTVALAEDMRSGGSVVSASSVNDGDFGTSEDFASEESTYAGNRGYLRLDLGIARPTDSITISSFDATMTVDSFDIDFSNDATFATGVTTVSVTNDGGGSFFGSHRILYPPQQVRYIRVRGTSATAGQNVWRINEVNLYHGGFDTASVISDDPLSLYVHEHLSKDTVSLADVQMVEGYMLWKVGGGAFLDPGHPYFAAPPVGVGDSALDIELLSALSSTEALVTQFDSSGRLRLATTETGVGNGGIGYGLALGPDNEVYTVGAPLTGTDGPVFSKLLSGAAGLTLDWQANGTAAEWQPYIDAGACAQIEVDLCGYPWRLTGDGRLVRTTDKGAILFDAAGPSMFALPPTAPYYGASDVCGPECFWSGTGTALTQRCVVARSSSGRTSTRGAVLAGVACENLYTFTGTSSLSVPEGGSGGLGSRGAVFGTVLYSELFLADGSAVRALDPLTGRLAVLETPHGESRLIESWRGRLVLAGARDDPHNWHMSASGDPRDWDEFPIVASENQAISANNAPFEGRPTSPINGIVPWSDDLLFFLCDAGVYRLTGNPMTNGQLDLVSDITGGAFGKAWCKDPEGRVYFFGSKGGVFVMSPGSVPVPLSLGRIQRKLEDIDLGVWRIHMEWNYRDRGFHVFQLPREVGPTPKMARHWFFERDMPGKPAAFWEDEFSSLGHQVTSVAVLDGDAPDDRTILLGCADGKLRAWSHRAASDAGQPIYSHALIGPLMPDNFGAEVKVSGLEGVLASDSAGVDWSLYAASVADQPGPPVARGRWRDGRNAQSRARARGTSVWVRVGNGGLDEHWSIENLAIDYAVAGRPRPR